MSHELVCIKSQTWWVMNLYASMHTWFFKRHKLVCIKVHMILNESRTCMHQVTYSMSHELVCLNAHVILQEAQTCINQVTRDTQWVTNAVFEYMYHLHVINTELTNLHTYTYIYIYTYVHIHMHTDICVRSTRDTQWVTNSVLDYMYLHVITINLTIELTQEIELCVRLHVWPILKSQLYND